MLISDIAATLAVQKAGQPGQLFDVFEFDDNDKKLITQTLGKGEVCGVAALPYGVLAQFQEAVVAGVWHIRFADSRGDLIAEYIEVGPIPIAVRRACTALPALVSHGPAPPGAMNVMPLLTEIGDRIVQYREGDPAHVIILSLFPMSIEDVNFLQVTLAGGPVQLTSRGYRPCRVAAAGARNVWSVQFYDNMDKIVLDMLQIVDIPSVVLATEEDFRESAAHLRDIEEAYFK
ncbi:hydrogenase expression/formation protein (plasmid) [Rhizobium sp. CB3060]|uniref:hydrogenase expression/formation protein n=1 Tax=Rhizobium sp. CB3060 TaxID=3138255 RepID=UPI0021A7E0DA|nr:hydrogenase expression/formation protein [Rhizobium tropici]UWU25718.1 hydrogenase expression/formation protein [Rhizobium tropici]